MRVSRPSTAAPKSPLLCDPADKARLEARNAILQFERVRTIAASQFGQLALSPAILCDLHKMAIQGIYGCAGSLRTGPVSIGGTGHQPPDHTQVPSFVDEMCDYANGQTDPIHASAYLMWRLNWIHPFFGGNGRTSRAVSYLALLAGFGFELPGTTTVPDFITQARQPYYDALDAADAAYAQGQIDVIAMEFLIADLLKKQLATAPPPAGQS